VWGPTWIEIHWNSIWLRARSRMTSHYTWGSVTTLHDLGGVFGTAFGHFLLGSHNFTVTALGLYVKWPLILNPVTGWTQDYGLSRCISSGNLDVSESLDAINRAWSTWIIASSPNYWQLLIGSTPQVKWENWNFCTWLTSQIEVIWRTCCRKVLQKLFHKDTLSLQILQTISWRSHYVYKNCKYYHEDHKTYKLGDLCNIYFQNVNFSHPHRPHLPPVYVGSMCDMSQERSRG
jgi:hypothetical protein